MKWPVTGSREDGWYDMNHNPSCTICTFDLLKLEEKTFISNVSGFKLDPNNGKIIVHIGNSVRILDAKTIPAKDIHSKIKFII